mmetsp:Transcript_24976/g.34976  ORF Transcript_24976/g.34976 Transcript_24976/m.34976 type:complete len:220 (-) Transcript_24976:73-732(-)
MKSFVIGMILISMVCQSFGQSAPPVQVSFFVMSKCPNAAEYITSFEKTVMQADGLPEILNITMNYIASVNSSYATGFYSKHGQTEVLGDEDELCVMSITQPTPSDSYITWWNFILCMFSDYADVPQNTQSCCDEVQVSYPQTQVCVMNQGDKLLTQSIKVTDSLGWPAPGPGSPTVYVDGSCIYGFPPCQAYDPSTTSVLNYICNAYTGTKPAGCNTSA